MSDTNAEAAIPASIRDLAPGFMPPHRTEHDRMHGRNSLREEQATYTTRDIGAVQANLHVTSDTMPYRSSWPDARTRIAVYGLEIQTSFKVR